MNVTYQLVVRIAWWVKPYTLSVALFAYLTGCEPDFERVARTVARGVRCAVRRANPSA